MYITQDTLWVLLISAFYYQKLVSEIKIRIPFYLKIYKFSYFYKPLKTALINVIAILIISAK